MAGTPYWSVLRLEDMVDYGGGTRSEGGVRGVERLKDQDGQESYLWTAAAALVGSGLMRSLDPTCYFGSRARP